MKLSLRVVSLVLWIGISLSALSLAHAESNPVEGLRACLLQLRTAQSWQQAQELQTKCLALAHPLAEDPSLSGRALYLQTLQLGRVSYTSASYLELFNQIDRYFSGHLQADLVPTKLAALAPMELEDALNAMAYEVYYSALTQLAPRGLDEAGSLFVELERRQIATADDAANLYDMYSVSSDYRSADHLAIAWNKLPRPLQIVGLGQIDMRKLNYLKLSVDTATFTPSPYILTGAQILVFGDCHFAYDAFKRLAAIPGIADVMSTRGFVISGPAGIDVDLIDSLRKQFPAFEMHPVYQMGHWFQKGVNVVESPNFVFMVDGVVRFAFTGDEPNIVDLFCSGSKQIGLGLPAGCRGSN